MPADLGVRLVKATRRQAALGHTFAYKPPLTVDDVSLTRREYRMLSADASREDPTVLVSVTPLHVGFFRLARQMTGSLETLSDTFGMSESEVDEVKELFTATDWRWMALTFVVSLLHSWFAFLAFKNDIGFWKKKSNLEGLSVRSQWSSFVCQLIIFANLADTGQASTIILCEMGISVAIEGWKVSKFLASDGTLHRLLGVGSRAEERTQAQKDTDEYDRRAMRFLSFCLYPVVVAYGLYSLAYHPQRSWRSWVLRTLANGVYMFGFIAMTPQLYINYRLKSVAHLPWKAFMYKAFNTFIDDVFAFAIAMPTIHRLACLRDDLVFFVYLYQRWIYPIDKKRVNEFGRAYEEDDEPREGEDTPDASAGRATRKRQRRIGDARGASHRTREGSVTRAVPLTERVPLTVHSFVRSLADPGSTRAGVRLFRHRVANLLRGDGLAARVVLEQDFRRRVRAVTPPLVRETLVHQIRRHDDPVANVEASVADGESNQDAVS